MFVLKKPPSVVVCCLIVAGALWPTPGDAATWLPELRLETRYDDNVLRDAADQGDVITAVTPFLRLIGSDPFWSWELRARRSFASYSRDPSPVILAQGLTLESLYQPSERESLFVSFRYTDALDPIEFEEGFIQRRQSERARGQARLTLGRLEAHYAARGWWYDDPDLVDGVGRSWSTRVLPLASRTTALTVGHRQQELDVPGRGIRVDVTTVGMRRAHARWLNTEIEVGRAEARFQDGTTNEISPAGALGIRMMRGSEGFPVEARLRIAHDLTTVVSAAIERRWNGSRTVAGVERVLDVEGGLYRNVSLARRAFVEWQSTDFDSRTLTLRASYGQVRPFRGEGTQADVFRATAMYEFPLRPGLGFRAAYDFWRQDVPGTGLDVEFDRHRVAVALTVKRGQP